MPVWQQSQSIQQVDLFPQRHHSYKLPQWHKPPALMVNPAGTCQHLLAPVTSVLLAEIRDDNTCTFLTMLVFLQRCLKQELATMLIVDEAGHCWMKIGKAMTTLLSLSHQRCNRPILIAVASFCHSQKNRLIASAGQLILRNDILPHQLSHSYILLPPLFFGV